MVYAWRTILFEGKPDEMHEAVHFYNLHVRHGGNAKEFASHGLIARTVTSTMISIGKYVAGTPSGKPPTAIARREADNRDNALHHTALVEAKPS